MTNAERDAIREYIQRTIDASVSKAVAAIDLSALRGKDGEKGDPGADGRDGNDAVLDKDALVREVISLIPTPKDGKDGRRGEKGIDGRDGRDGKDGIASLDDLRAEVAKAVEQSVGPTVEKQVAESFAVLPTLQYRGVFREGSGYPAGSVVTWAGSAWHADEATKEKPGEGQTAWTLMVKRGANGRDAT